MDKFIKNQKYLSISIFGCLILISLVWYFLFYKDIVKEYKQSRQIKRSLSSEVKKYKGMHGYDPYLSSMHGIFYAYGPKIKSGYKISKFENIHIYPFICRLLGIVEYDNEIDGPDGDIKVLENILWDFDK